MLFRNNFLFGILYIVWGQKNLKKNIHIPYDYVEFSVRRVLILGV